MCGFTTINYVALKSSTPAVIAAMLGNITLGEIIRVLPGRTPCLECIRRALQSIGSIEPGRGEGGRDDPYGGSPLKQNGGGSRVDISIVAGLQARVALDTLEDDSLAHLRPSYWVWASKPSGYAYPFGFDKPLSIRSGEPALDPACPVCSDKSSPNGTSMDERYARLMEQLNGHGNCS